MRPELGTHSSYPAVPALSPESAKMNIITSDQWCILDSSNDPSEEFIPIRATISLLAGRYIIVSTPCTFYLHLIYFPQ